MQAQTTQPQVAPIFLLDASIVIFRYYFALAPNWSSDEGYETQAVYGYSHWLKRFLSAVKPHYMAACFDESLGTCFRNEIYPDYKCSRPPPDEGLAFQLEACKQITQMFGLPCFASERYEADDLIGSLALKAQNAGQQVVILSRDKDLGQLLKDGDSLWHYPDEEPLGVDGITAKFGVKPEQLADYLALVGDAIDDIPGVPGIGPKTAAALLAAYPDVEAILNHLDCLAQLPVRGASKLPQKLLAHLEQIHMAKRLSKIYCQVNLGDDLSLSPEPPDLDTLRAFARHMGFSLDSLKPQQFERS